MKSIKEFLVRLPIVLGMYLGVSMATPAYAIFIMVTQHSDEWMGGVNPDFVLIWLYISVVGFGSLIFASAMALFGLLFGHKRLAAFWFLIFPGIVCLLTGTGAMVLLIQHDPDWLRYHNVWSFGSIMASGIFFIASGIMLRVRNPRKKAA